MRGLQQGHTSVTREVDPTDSVCPKIPSTPGTCGMQLLSGDVRQLREPVCTTLDGLGTAQYSLDTADVTINFRF